MRTRRPRPPRDDPLAANDTDRERDRLAQLIAWYHPDLARAAYYLVAPEHTDALLASTWCRAWEQWHRYPGTGYLPWLHQIMVDIANTDPVTCRPGAAGHLPVNFTAADLGKHFIADHVEAVLANLSPREATIIRRRHLARQGWLTITREMRYRNILQTIRAYRKAKKQFRHQHSIYQNENAPDQ